MRLQRLSPFVLALAALPAVGSLSSCSSLYYGTMEQMGMHVRDILVDRVVQAKEVQQVAQEQFKTTLETFQEVAGSEQDTKIQTVYKKLKREYDDCEKRAGAVSDRVDAVESASVRMFDEWQDDVDSMSDPDMRGRNANMLSDAQSRYKELISKMREAEGKMEPVLEKFRDRVTLIKGAVNYEAVASLGDTLVAIEDDVADLIEDMQASIDEADEFIAEMPQA